MDEIQQVQTKVVYQNKWMTVREDIIRRASGSEGLYGVVEKRDFAVIIAVLQDEIIFVEQYRYPVSGRWIELPQGAWDGLGSKPIEEVAALELREETGYVAKTLTCIGEQFVAYGYSNQKYYIFWASQLEAQTPSPEMEEEGLQSGRMKIADFEKLILKGAIQDSSTVTAFLLARAKGYL